MKPTLSNPRATVIAAVVGALLGSIGAEIIKDWLSERQRVDLDREKLIRENVYGLQESAEQLWYRIYNAPRQKARKNNSSYCEDTTLYALGRTLATACIISLKGRSPLVLTECKELGEFLREDKLGNVLVSRGLRYYHRLALAESLMVHVEGSPQVSTYLDYHKRIVKGNYSGEELFESVKVVIDGFKSNVDEELLQVLCELISKSAVCTGVPVHKQGEIAKKCKF